MTDLFTEIILDEAKHPSNYGTLEGDHLKKIQFNPSCGDVIQVTLRVNEEKQIIEDLKWTGQGCSVSMAAMSLLSGQIKGRPIAEALAISQKDLLQLLELETITPGRIKCLLIGLQAVQDLLSEQK